MNKDLKIAILIDADNISDKYVKIILGETAAKGVATYKRIYGDWTSTHSSSWKKVLLENSIIPIQQYSYTCLLYTSYQVPSVRLVTLNPV